MVLFWLSCDVSGSLQDQDEINEDDNEDDNEDEDEGEGEEQQVGKVRRLWTAVMVSVLMLY